MTTKPICAYGLALLLTGALCSAAAWAQPRRAGADAAGVAAMPTSITYTFSHSTTADFPDVGVATLKIENINGATRWTLKTDWDSDKYRSAALKELDFSTTKTLTLAPQASGEGVRVLLRSVGAGVTFARANGSDYHFVSGEQLSWEFKNTVWSDFSGLDVHVVALDRAQPLHFGGVAEPIEEPHPYVMLMIGLGLLGFTARRSSKRFE